MIGDKIKLERTRIGLSQAKLAEKLNLTQQAIAKWEKGQSEPDSETIIKLCTIFKVSTDYLLGRTEKENNIDIYKINNIMSLNREFVKMPIIGTISAGYDGIAQEDYQGDIEILEMSLHGHDPADCFILRVKGNSMYPDYFEGDLVAIHKQSAVDSGTVAVVLYNGDEATLKKVRYVQGENWIELIPRNPEYQTKRIEGEDLEQCYILGKVLTLVYRDLR